MKPLPTVRAVLLADPEKSTRLHEARPGIGYWRFQVRVPNKHCIEQHLHRYLAEFDFRYSNRVRLGVHDEDRAVRAVKGVVGKRLTYRTTSRKMKDDEDTPSII